MLDITMKLDIPVRLTPQITTIICHHMIMKLLLKILLKFDYIYLKKNIINTFTNKFRVSYFILYKN